MSSFKTFTKAPLNNEGVQPVVINTDHILFFQPSVADQVGETQIHLSGDRSFSIDETATDLISKLTDQVFHLSTHDPRTNSVWDDRSVFVVLKQLRAVVPYPAVNRLNLEFFDGKELIVKHDHSAEALLEMFKG